MSTAGRLNIRSRRVLRLALVALVAGNLVLIDSSQALAGRSGASHSPVIPSADTDTGPAAQFRWEMGLDASVEAIMNRASLFDPSPVFGLPLSPDEEALMLERGRIQQELDPLRSYRRDHDTSWGGLWLSYPLGGTKSHALTLNVALTEADGLIEHEIASLLPDGADLSITIVNHAQRTLDAMHERLVADEAFFRSIGTELHSIATDVKTNRVEASVSPLNVKIETAISERYGVDLVRAVEAGDAGADACSRSNCGPPWLAGLKIAKSGPMYCTSNFIVKRYLSGVWNYAMLTSGHCGNATWKQGSTSGATIGTSTWNYFTSGSYADIQVIPISQANGGLDDYLYGSAICTSCIKHDVRIRECNDCDEVGEIISNNGAFSGVKYGTVSATNVTCLAIDCTLLLYHQRRATYTRMGGDSGGPVTALSGTNYDIAVGSHTNFQTISGTEYAVYSHAAEIEAATGWTIWFDQ